MALDFSKADWTAFTPADPDQQTLVGIESGPEVQLRSTLGEAIKVQPDAQARINRLSRESGIPAFAVEPAPDEVEQDLRFKNVDFSQMSKRSPNTSKFLTDFNNAAIAHDDIDALEFAENVVKSVRGALPFDAEVSQVQEFGRDISGAFGKGSSQVESADIGVQRMWSAIGLSDPVPQESIDRLTELDAQLAVEAEGDYGFLSGAPITAAQQLPILFRVLSGGVTGAAEAAIPGAAVGGSIGIVRGRATPGPLQAASAVSGTVAGGILGAQFGARVGVAKESFNLEAGLAFNEFAALKDDAGNLLDPEIAGYAASAVGGINAGLEYISLAALGRTVTPVVRAAIKSKVKEALSTEPGREAVKRIGLLYAKSVGTEAVTEGLQEFTNVVGGELAKFFDEGSFEDQDVIKVLDNVFSEETVGRVAESMEAGAQAGLIFGAPGTTLSIVAESNQRRAQGDREQVIIDNINKLDADVKLKTRDVEAFKQFLRDADGEQNTNVFIDGAQASLYLRSLDPATVQADPALSLLQEQASEASQLQTDISIPVDEFAASFTGTEHFDALRPHMTLSAESVSQFRQEQVQQETNNFVRSLMDTAQENVSQYVEAQGIFETVKAQLIDTGTVTPQNAGVMAQLVPAWATVYALKHGVTVQEAFDQSGLSIVGPQTGRKAELELAQGRIFTEDELINMDIDELDRLAFGVTGGEVVSVSPDQLSVIYPDDLENPQESFRKGGMAWVNSVDLSEPIEVSVDDQGNFNIEDGHHRYFAAQKRGVSLQAEISIKGSPVRAILKRQSAPLEQKTAPEARGYYDPANAVIRMTEAADLSTFLHEFAHFMYEMERSTGSDTATSIGNWFKRNGAAVAKEANGYLKADRGALEQAAVDLDMSTEARLGRARAMGFDTSTTYFHGTAADFKEFIIGASDRHGDLFGAGVYVTSDPRLASSYAGSSEGANVLPVFLRGNYYDATSDSVLPSDVAEVLSDFVNNNLNEGDKARVALDAGGGRKTVFFDDLNEADEFFDTQERNWETFSGFDRTSPEYVGTPDNIGVSYVDFNAPVSFTGLKTGDVFDALQRIPGSLMTDAFRSAGFDGVKLERQTVVFNPENLRSTNAAFDPTRSSSAELLAQSPEIPGGPAAGAVTPEDVTNYIDTGSTGAKAKDDALYRAVHEQFARGFETYLMKGEAPSIELRNAFRTFARWLAQVYQSIKGNLNVNVDAEMRAVFDRLLATEEQIAAAEARARYEPMFTDAAMAGMTEEDFAAYQKQKNKTKDKQSETLRDKLIEQLTRAKKQWWREEKKDLIEEEANTLRDQQVYSTADRLKTGDIKLDYAAVKERVGEERTNKLGRTSTVIPSELSGMTARGGEGVHPDEAAAFFGYNSGDEMLTDLITAPKLRDQAEANAEKRMLEMHGDIMNDGTIEREADEAVQNEERGKLILMELKALTKGTGRPAIDRQTIKTLAAENIGKLSFRQIHPGKYRKAEIAAAQESARMLAEGNRDGAAVAKTRQVLNYYLGMEATAAKNDTMSIVDRMARYNKKAVREAIQKAENGYWEQLVKILGRFEFRKAATLKDVESLNTWMVARMTEDGDALVLSPRLLDESYVTHWKNIPFADLQGIADSVKNIEHVAKYANKMQFAEQERDFKQLVGEWTTHIKSISQKFPTKETRSRIDDTRQATLGEKSQRFISQLTKIPFMASWLDGGERVGMSHDIMMQNFTDALDAKLKLIDEVATPVYKLIENRSKADRKRHARKIFIPEINDNLLGHQVVAVALNTGNQSNLRKMLLGEGWADPENDATVSFDNPQLQAVLKHMTRSDWEMVQEIWDQMEKLYPQLAEVHRRTTGLTPPKVQSTPVVTPFGTFNGGYYPVKYSPKRGYSAERNAEKQEAETESMFNNTASIQASVNAGATNERTGFYAPIMLDLGVIPDHFQETIHYITHHDAVRQMNKLLRNNSVESAITGALGEAEFKQLKPWLNDIAKDGRQQPTKTFIHEAFQRLRFGVTLGAMGFKASTGIMQFFGLFTTAAELGVGPTIKGVQAAVGGAWYMRSIRKILGSTDNMQSSWEFAVERSKVMGHRDKTMDREIRNAMERLSNKSGVLAAIQEASMKHIALIQTYMVDLPTWHAAYEKTLSETGDEARAVNYADWAVENLQGSGATKDMAQILRNQDKIHTTFTMFMTFFSSLGNLSRDLTRGTRSGLYSPTSVAAKLMFLYTLPVFMEMLIRGDLDEPEDEDERLQKYLTGVALYPVASIPFVRDVVSGTVGEYGYNVTPVASVLERGITGVKQIRERALTDDEITKGALKGVTKLGAAAVGVPGVNQVWASGEHLYDVLAEGEDFTLREFLFGPKRE